MHIRYHWLELFSFFNNSQINFILHWLKRLGNVLWMCFYETYVNIVSICIPTTEIQFFLIICISSSLFHCYKEMFLKQKCASCVWQRSLNKYLKKTKKINSVKNITPQLLVLLFWSKRKVTSKYVNNFFN